MAETSSVQGRLCRFATLDRRAPSHSKECMNTTEESMHQATTGNRFEVLDIALRPEVFAGVRSEVDEVRCTVGFSTRGARRRTLQYVEHPEMRNHSWVLCIVGRGR